MTAVESTLDQRSVNTIRTLSIDAIEKANSGHPGLPLGAAPMAHVLFSKHLKFAPQSPDWPDRDRFVLSAGHGSMLLYSVLHLAGYDVTLDELKTFRQWGSRTAGHPEFGVLPGVEATTGPLGQGTANAVGMALAERALAQRFNRPGHEIVDHWTYALVSDGDLMEGIAAEAASLAGHLGLGKLVYLYDANDVSLDGPLDMMFTEDIGARYQAHGWQVLTVVDGDNDLAAIEAALTEARSDTDHPTLIIVKTTIGYGSPSKAGTAASHGAPLGAEETRGTKEALGWDPDATFHVPDDVRALYAEIAQGGAQRQAAWNERLARWRAEFPELATEWDRVWTGELPADFEAGLPTFAAGESIATRSAGGKALQAVAAAVPELIGGDADLSCSTKTAIADSESFDARGGAGRNIHFGVREHAMGAIANGMLYHGGVRPYTSTFFVFSDYMRPSVRLAALAELPSIYVWTHDSVAVGEDGPTHEPVEHLMSLRAMPNLRVVRPADANETAWAWAEALKHKSGPTALVFSRQNLPVLEGSTRSGFDRGAYVVADCEGAPDALLLATGSEVHVALAAQGELAGAGIATRVVSMPCWETFAEQDQAYRDEVLPPAITARVAVEAGATLGWERWIGMTGRALGIDRFGASAPGDTNLAEFGFTSARVAEIVREVLGR